MHKSARQIADEIEGIWGAADAERRPLTSDERRYVADLVAEAKGRAEVERQIKILGHELGGGGVVATDPNASFTNGGGPGDVFVQSKGYKQIKDPASRPQQWSSGPVEVSSTQFLTKGTLLESTAGGPGGGLVPPMYQPGVVEKLFEAITVSDLFGTSQTTASQVRYINEGTATNAAAGVAEAGTKPESTLGLSEVVEPIKKIATVLPVSDELLEDATSIQSYLNGRLSLFVKLEEERQLLRGAGTNELVGLMAAGRAINTYSKLAADDNATSLARVIANTAGSSFVPPTAIVMHPTNWLNTRLLRDGTGGTVGQYLGGGPFTGAYGNPGQPGIFGQSLWGLPVALSTHVGLGTAVVGAFNTAAHVWRRGGVSVEATNSHSDWFQKNLNMLRAEERLGLGVYRPVAFTEVRGLA